MTIYTYFVSGDIILQQSSFRLEIETDYKIESLKDIQREEEKISKEYDQPVVIHAISLLTQTEYK